MAMSSSGDSPWSLPRLTVPATVPHLGDHAFRRLGGGAIDGIQSSARPDLPAAATPTARSSGWVVAVLWVGSRPSSRCPVTRASRAGDRFEEPPSRSPPRRTGSVRDHLEQVSTRPGGRAPDRVATLTVWRFDRRRCRTAADILADLGATASW